MLCYQTIQSPIGVLRLIADDKSLQAIVFEQQWEAYQTRHSDLVEKTNPIIKSTQAQLTEYFAGQRTAFDVPLVSIGTDFQQQAWKALLDIPYGETRSYSDQANMINNPKAVRAIGSANGANPIPIIVPCHRVVGKSGQLTGYAGGMDTKAFLLDLEGTR